MTDDLDPQALLDARWITAMDARRLARALIEARSERDKVQTIAWYEELRPLVFDAVVSAWMDGHVAVTTAVVEAVRAAASPAVPPEPTDGE